jgi:hypothetical protein
MATVQAREDAWHVTCPHCLRFMIDPYLLELFESARRRSDLRILRLLPRLSEAARQTAGEGGRLDLVDRTNDLYSDHAMRLVGSA